uniref:Uncharacterized protein n=1 Tax=Anguilla anguilla TaxID=7936 RepID=A0A0E9W8K1_ANGAN
MPAIKKTMFRVAFCSEVDLMYWHIERPIISKEASTDFLSQQSKG